MMKEELIKCKLGESWEKFVFLYCFFCIITHV